MNMAAQPGGAEVWPTVDTRPESLAAVVADTQKLLVLETGSTYVVRIRARCAAGADGPSTPAALGAAWPNPFNARVTLTYHVPDAPAADAPFGMTIHDLRGCLVATLRLDR